MKNSPKRNSRRRTIFQLRALFITITSVSLAVLGGVLGLLAAHPNLTLAIAIFMVIVGLAGIGYAATYLLFLLDYEEKRIEHAEAAEQAKQQLEDMEAAIKRGMVGAIAELLQQDTLTPTLKDTIRNAVREELAHANLADKTPDIELPEAEADDTADTSQQNS